MDRTDRVILAVAFALCLALPFLIEWGGGMGR
jgi:hypothetical protein